MSTLYRVTVYTGTPDGAGTDANVFLTLYGDKAVGRERQLDNGLDNFENGAVDVFAYETSEELGELTAARIRHDDSRDRSGWFLDKLIITKETPPVVESVFPCGRWLAIDEEEGVIERLLFPN